MKILKRNQLIILVISLMLVTAGYLNFTSTNAQDNTKETVAELGDATLVNSNKIENENVVENSVEQEAPKQRCLSKRCTPCDSCQLRQSSQRRSGGGLHQSNQPK